ncbi:hypothetical protein CFP56_008483 [Quercus suber]|uniref:Uncharacterized protein n=1 Tax=Quercus suber TaxID=58331 RepID=A0AAW0L4X1_QUESU
MVSDARAIEGGDGRIAGFSRLLGGLSPQFRSSNSIRTLCYTMFLITRSKNGDKRLYHLKPK